MSNETKQANSNEYQRGDVKSLQRLKDEVKSELIKLFTKTEDDGWIAKNKEWEKFTDKFFAENSALKEDFRKSPITIKSDEIDSLHLFNDPHNPENPIKNLEINFSLKFEGSFKKVDFNGLTRGIYGINFKGDIDFSHSKFLEKFSFNECGFEGVKFLFSEFICDAGLGWNNFKKGEFSSATFHKKAQFDLSEFGEKANFSSSKFEGSASFGRARFLGICWFSQVKFKEITYFREAKFSEYVGFNSAAFGKNAEFDLAEFKQSADFSQTRFEGDVRFSNNDNFGGFNELLLDNALFKGAVRFYDSRNVIKKFSAKGTVFEDLATFDLNFETCPDFSRAEFFKKFRIRETWIREGNPINQSEILSPKEDEEKFRFLKKYFADQGNHFKEREYFAYEMMAAEKNRLEKLQLSNLKTKIFAKNFMVAGLAILKWVKGYLELILFKVYKWTSGYGASMFLPFFWLIVSCAIVNLFFLVPLGSAVELTIAPISRSESVKEIFKDTEPVLNVLSLINLALIFLLGLGIRNKFKIK